jgi:hypothetical protein
MARKKSDGCCLLGCLSILSPRLIIILMVIFSDYLGDAYESWWAPLLGFFFLPITTIAYAVAENQRLDDLLWWGVVGLGVVLDFGLLGGGSWGIGKKKR